MTKYIIQSPTGDQQAAKRVFIKQKLLLASLTTLLISGCAVGPDYNAPKLEVPQNWQASETGLSSQSQAAKLDWWKIFNDPLLEKYIAQSIESNHDLKVARLHVREARLMRGITSANYAPQVGLKAANAYVSQSENGLLPVAQIPGFDRSQNVFETGFDASWEIDIFGHVQRTVEVADARTETIIEQRRHVLLSVISEVARNYFEIRGLQRRIMITEKNITLQQSSVNMVHQQLDNGTVSQFDLERAIAQLQASQARLPNIRAELTSARNRLILLVGAEPDNLLSDLKNIPFVPTTPDVVPLGLPSEMLLRRPDVRQAERELARATAQIGVETSNLYPRFSLTGSVGLESTTFGDLVKGSSVTGLFGGVLNWPIFQGGRLRTQIKVAETRTEIAKVQYNQKILHAFKDVETSLTQYGRELETYNRLNNAKDTAKSVSDIARLRYKHGVENFLTVLDADRSLMAREDELVKSETRSLTRLIALFKSLGGGWEITEQPS